MTLKLSVIICTHNPRQDYLHRVVDALRGQTLPADQWEMLVVDNASNPPISDWMDLAWHPKSFFVREDKIGLTPARLRGIRETQAELIIFVDDDNVLDTDYLEKSVEISQERPDLGAWGGRISPEFESSPPEWARAYPWCLGLREFERDQWACLPTESGATPYGAGLVVRRSIAETYAEKTCHGSLGYSLDRNGKSLTSCGDLDLALTSWDCRMGTGTFVRLHLTHLIPSSRLENGYLERWQEGNAYSTLIFEYIHGQSIRPERTYERIFRTLRGLLWKRRFERIAYYAQQRGLRRARRYLIQLHRE
ncbi:MAG: glycosyltransferase [Syntrophobacteraceae bacterium]